jgi:hypothetical protein
MTDSNELVEKHDIFLSLEGKRLAAKSALVGSIVFGVMYLVLIYVNTYLIERIDVPPFDIPTILLEIVLTIIITMIAIALTYFPARFMGGRLANALEIDASNHILTERSAVIKGAKFGVLAACIVCLPILVLEFLFILITRHGGILPSLFLTAETILIASIAGGWTGNQLGRLMIK